MVRDGRSVPMGAQTHPKKRVEWVAKRTVMLRLMNVSLVMKDILVYTFGHELERYLHPLLGARGSEEMAMQWLVCTSARNWKLMIPLAVCEYVLVAPNVCMKGIAWSIEKLRAALMPSMVVTGVPLELLNADVKDGVIVLSKGVLQQNIEGS